MPSPNYQERFGQPHSRHLCGLMNHSAYQHFPTLLLYCACQDPSTTPALATLWRSTHCMVVSASALAILIHSPCSESGSHLLSTSGSYKSRSLPASYAAAFNATG